MKRNLLLAAVVVLAIFACSKEKKIEAPSINEFSATPTTLPKKDTVTYTIDAVGDKITFYDGKNIIDLTDVEMPYVHKVGKIRFNVTAPADTVVASLAVVNIYDAEVIKESVKTIPIILLDE